MTTVATSASYQKRLVVVAILRGALTASVLVALYYLLPLRNNSDATSVLKLVLGFLAFLCIIAWQIRAITESRNPGLRALEGMLLAVPLFLILFATGYYLLSQAHHTSFTAPLSRTDALYFTVTVFSTVGFGDISARTETARLMVTIQMLLDLVILGLGARIILNAVQRGRDRLTNQAADN